MSYRPDAAFGDTSPTWERSIEAQPDGRLPGVDVAHTAALLSGGKGQFDPMRFVGVGLSQQSGEFSHREEVGDD